MNMRFLRTLLVVTPILLLAACSGGGGGSEDQQAIALNSQLAIANNYIGGVVGVNTTAFALVNEFEQDGRDMNGDGDFADNVVVMIDSITGAQTNLATAGVVGITANDTHVAWGVPEGAQNNTDLNGDGDQADTVLFIFDPTMPVSPTNPQNTGVVLQPSGEISGAGNTFAVRTVELNNGTDLNGDGDTDDVVLQIYNTATMTSFGTNVALAPGLIVNRFDQVLFVASESDQQTGPMGGPADLNGDGDTTGTILMVADSAAMTVTPVGPGGGRNVSGQYFTFGTAMNPFYVYQILETTVSLNMNGLVNDVDTSDTVCAIFDPVTMTESFPGGGVAIQPDRISGSSTTMTFCAVEGDNTAAGFDFNGDGDASDFVPFFVQFAAPTVAHNMNIAQSNGSNGFPLVCGTSVLLLASEAEQGLGVNYNIIQGDTDTSDLVFFHVDTTTLPVQLTSLNLAGREALCLSESPDFITIIAPEADNGNTDFNIDGDTGDEIGFFFPINNGVVSTIPVRVGSSGNTVLQDCGDHVRYISFAPEGSSIAFGDVNRDGDFDDFVLQTIKVRKSDGDTMATSVLGTVDPDIATMEFPAILSPFLLAFPTPEDSIGNGVNLNANQGDTDMFDNILFLGRLDCN